MRRFLKFTLVSIITVFASYASACSYFREVTYYFGTEDYISDDEYSIDFAVAKRIKNNRVIVFDDGPKLREHHGLYMRNGVLFVKGIPTDRMDESFRYLDNGYYTIHGNIYYRGRFEATYPKDGSVRTWNEMRADFVPPRQPGMPPVISPCGDTSSPWFILESSNGLHLEHKESGSLMVRPFPRGDIGESVTGYSCAQMRVYGQLDEKREKMLENIDN
ncbi:hypothetical protein PWP93_23845 [Paraburkholderia sp. A1RI-2L]|uniref:hypothetical protein n=1 Tax=Paraburkholderia sp. A1RI-2L TaxID=3028367 RepID=UPI003B799776